MKVKLKLYKKKKKKISHSLYHVMLLKVLFLFLKYMQLYNIFNINAKWV